MNELYEQFTTQLLPQIQEGLVITKDYFVDLFGRYVTYLLVVDTLALVLLVLSVIGLVYAGVKMIKANMKDEDGDLAEMGYIFGGTFIVVAIIILTIPLFEQVDKVAKDIFVPEIRVLEEIQGFRNK